MTLENLKSKPLVEAIKDLYTFNNQVQVIQYLSEQEYLISLLLEAHQKIREVFPNEQLGLRVSSDPEILGWKRLLIAIHTNLDADEAFDKLKLIENNWWLDAASEVGNDLDIHIEFNDV